LKPKAGHFVIPPVPVLGPAPAFEPLLLVFRPEESKEVEILVFGTRSTFSGVR
jgi:hypothetical protein